MSDARRRRSNPARFALRLTKIGAAGFILCAAALVHAQDGAASSSAPPAGLVMGAYGQSLQLIQEQQAQRATVSTLSLIHV